MTFVEWMEPRPALCADGTEKTANVTLCMTAEDAVCAARYALEQRGICSTGIPDDKLLDEFIVVHWAVVREYE